MKMSMNATEVASVIRSQTATRLNCEVERLSVVMKVSGGADIYLDQAPDAPITRKRKAGSTEEKAEVSVTAPVAEQEAVDLLAADPQVEQPAAEAKETDPAVEPTTALWP